MPETEILETVKPHYPVLIIGAGINGCGTFRDLCLQGVDCLLIDRGDVCEGASAASSRLIHGGIKYLEMGEFRLVRESAMERNRLLRNAPHYVKPLETVLPIRSWFGGLIPSARRFLGMNAKLADRGAIVTELGLRIYDAYNRKVRALPDHRFFRSERLRQDYPRFAEEIIAAGLYYEGQITHAERLGLELVKDGLATNPGSRLCTYVSATAGEAPGVIQLIDQITGDTCNISADIIINAGGAWIDKVNAGLGIASNHMGGSKGSHVIVDNPELLAALKGRMIYFGTADGRVNLLYPFFGHVLLGSTDIAVKDPDDAFCSEAETDYLLGAAKELFPSIEVTHAQVILTYCGVRPLPKSNGKDIGAVSRDHAIARDQFPGLKHPVLSLIGGKWTTFRAFSAQAADEVLTRLGKTRRRSTEDLAIGGGRGYPKDARDRTIWVQGIALANELSISRAEALLARYGSFGAEVAKRLTGSSDAELVSIPGYSRAEIAFLCEEEPLRRLSDLAFRRTTIAMEGLLTPSAIEELGRIAGATLGWSSERTAHEIAHTQAELQRRLPGLNPAA